jgi:uncharacterized membrane protein (DUF4010 family)
MSPGEFAPLAARRRSACHQDGAGWRSAGGAGTRVAGVRTFTLIGLFGGLAGLFTAELGPAVVIVAFTALAALVVGPYLVRAREGGRQSATTEVAALVTFALALGPPLGHGAVCGAAAVVVTLFLGWKRGIHGAVERLEEVELQAALKLLALAFVLMPLLPDEPFGPWDAINLHELLWMVLLLAGLSFVGYMVMRRAGARIGLALAALLGGLVSSTAVTLDFARRARTQPQLTPLLASGIVGAGGTMFARVIVLLAVVRPALLPLAAPPLGLAALFCWGDALLAWRRSRREDDPPRLELKNPLELGLALKFALLLALVALAAGALRAWLGDRGVYALSVVAGLGDVDAITLTLARQSALGLDATIAVHGVLIASAVDTVLKAGLAFGLGGRALGWHVSRSFAVAIVLGGAALVLVSRW